MNVEEFHSQTRATLEATLNQLQAATLLVAELEAQITDAGRTVQHLSQVIEQFISSQSTSVVSETSCLDQPPENNLSNS